MTATSDHATGVEPTAEDIDRRLRIDLAFVRDLIGAGTLCDDHMVGLLDWVASWHRPDIVGRWVKLSPEQHAAVKAVAVEAIRARGGEFPDGIWVWRSVGEDGELRAMARTIGAEPNR